MAGQSGVTAYDPSDPTQQAFLSALALGETGGSANAYSMGYGGTNLAGAATDQYGFPQSPGGVTGAGPTHAAGAFQFEPSTWDSLAATFGLNFQNPQDQNAGAWYEAQQAYSQATGGQSLESALQSKNYSSVEQALASVWPSVTGSGGAPQGLAADLASGTGANLGSASGTSSSATGAGSSSQAAGPSIFDEIDQFFVRFGLIILGGLVILVALWQLLSNAGAVPSPASTAKAAGKALAFA